MKPGGGKQKGAQFERDICKRLSLWVSGGQHEDLFWRSAMSGGRASVGKKRGKEHRRQAGDISAVSLEGCSLTDRFYVECKFVKNLGLELFLLEDRGPIAAFWSEAVGQARRFKKMPLLIMKQNRWHGPLVVGYENDLCRLVWSHLPILLHKVTGKHSVVVCRFDALTLQEYYDGSKTRVRSQDSDMVSRKG
jgi:hypothetical protein